VSAALRFPSGARCPLVGLPKQSSGRTTLADGSEGAQLQPELAKPLPPSPAGFGRVSSERLAELAGELGTLLDAESLTDAVAPWFSYAATLERQALSELARRAL
jgi:hypothetical protein